MNTSNLIDKAQTLIVEEQFDEALGICDEVIDKLRRLLGNALYVKGLALTRDKGFSDAAATSNKSTEMEPTVFDALLKQGLSFMQEGEWACALTAIDEGLHRAEKTNERDNATWWHLKGEAHRNLEQFDEALEYLIENEILKIVDYRLTIITSESSMSLDIDWDKMKSSFGV